MIYCDNSELQTFKDCNEKARLTYVQKLRKKEEGTEDTYDLDYGSAIHAGLQYMYETKGAWGSDTVENMGKRFEAVCPVDAEGTRKAKSVDTGKRLFRDYFQKYTAQDSEMEVIAVEVYDFFELAPGVRFEVVIDLVFKKQGCIYFMDHKSTGKRISAEYWNMFEMSDQLTGYTAYCQAKFGQCAGGWINVLGQQWRDKAPKLVPVDAPETHEWSEVVVKYSPYYKKDMASCKGYSSDLRRQLFCRTPQQVDYWKRETLQYLQNYEHLKQQSNHTWLTNKGQCWRCDKKEICLNQGDPQVISGLYEKYDPKYYLRKGELANVTDSHTA